MASSVLMGPNITKVPIPPKRAILVVPEAESKYLNLLFLGYQLTFSHSQNLWVRDVRNQSIRT